LLKQPKIVINNKDKTDKENWFFYFFIL
jgi:hypothetical protein